MAMRKVTFLDSTLVLRGLKTIGQKDITDEATAYAVEINLVKLEPVMRASDRVVRSLGRKHLDLQSAFKTEDDREQYQEALAKNEDALIEPELRTIKRSQLIAIKANAQTRADLNAIIEDDVKVPE